MTFSVRFAIRAAAISLAAVFALMTTLAPARAQTDSAAVADAPPPATLPADTPVDSSSGILKNAPPADQAVAGDPRPSNIDQSLKSGVQEVTATVESAGEDIARLSSAQRRRWDRATAAFPAFCHDWGRMLHDREVNNLAHLQWKEHDGYETATYIGYGKVQSCQAKESQEGVPIGKVIYQEMSYYLAGKTIDDARAHPKLIGTTNTLEIFSWEKDRWFY